MDTVCRVRHSRCSPTGRGKAFTLTLATGCHGMGSWRGHREHEPGHRTATSRPTALPGPTLQGTCSVPWTSCSLSFQSTDLVQQGPSPRALPTPPYDLNSGVLTGSVLTSPRVVSRRQPASQPRDSGAQASVPVCETCMCGIHLGPHKTATVTRLKNFVEF